MPRCAGIKRDGGQCTAIVNGSQTYCYQHDPARADERRRNASKAARSKPSKKLGDINSASQTSQTTCSRGVRTKAWPLSPAKS